MALLAPAGSFLIFEQPELHLHPKVQARLGDFFLALALDGKQLLLETHSEYLVDRFRLRIALSSSDKVRHLVNILFSEKVGSSSSLEPVEISEYGAVLKWPKDFFEQSQRDVGRIVKAASGKRRSKSNS
jgi:predicted ATPase